jgi:subtilase family protein
MVAPASAAATPPAPVTGSAASGGKVIVVLKDQHSDLNLRTQGAARKAAAFADQAPLVADIRAHGGTGISQLVSLNAIAATVSAAEVARLRASSAVAQIAPDTAVPMDESASAAATAAAAATARPATTSGSPVPCPTIPGEPGKPAQEPEAMADIHASTGNPNSPQMANSIATGKGVIVAINGMNQLAGNPDFQRPDGSHVVINAPDYTKDNGNDESYGDASSVASQGNVVFSYAQALPNSNIPGRCTFTIKGDAPDASLVDTTQIDTPPSPNLTLDESQLIAGVDNAVTISHADVISESYGGAEARVPTFVHTANDAAVAAGVTVVVSSGDSGSSGTMNPIASDPDVIAAGAVDNFRLVAMAHGYSGYVSNNIAAISSGGTAVTNKLVDLVAPGYMGEADCNLACPAESPTESMRGTSEAAPIIAGAAADVIQAYRDTHAGASPTPAQVKEILTSTATDLGAPADQQGAGLLNVYNAVRAAQAMPGSTDPAASARSGSLVHSPSQLDLTGKAGSVNSTSVQLYNTSSRATKVKGSYRVMGPARQIGRTVTENISAPDPNLPLPADGAQAAAPIHFTVPTGLDRLDADMIWPDATHSNVISFELVDPQGRLEQWSYDDGQPGRNGAVGTVSDDQHAEITNPEPGRWTANIRWSGTDEDLAVPPAAPGTYTGSMSFRISGQDFSYSPATTRSVTIPARSSATIPLRVPMPAAPGDHPESVQFTSTSGPVTSLGIARRSFIPSSGGPFRTLITSTVGRAVGQVSTYDLQVQSGTSGLDIAFHTADASPDNKYTYFLIDPSGSVAATDTTPKTVTGQSVATAELTADDPAAGTWQIDVVLNLTVSGKEFTQTVYGFAHVTR